MTWNFGSRSKIDFKVKYIRLKDFFDEIKCKKFLIFNSIWKKTFKTIHQLSCFLGHPVD